jgi:3-dehydrosphinganine reductase
LESELMLYPGLSVHIYFPGSILTPGCEEEQRDKPKLTKEIDGAHGIHAVPPFEYTLLTLV